MINRLSLINIAFTIFLFLSLISCKKDQTVNALFYNITEEQLQGKWNSIRMDYKITYISDADTEVSDQTEIFGNLTAQQFEFKSDSVFVKNFSRNSNTDTFKVEFENSGTFSFIDNSDKLHIKMNGEPIIESSATLTGSQLNLKFKLEESFNQNKLIEDISLTLMKIQ